VLARESESPAAVVTANGAQKFHRIAKCETSKLQNPKTQDPILATLTGSSVCTSAGISARGYSPVLKLCRKLVEAGFDHRLPLHVYRGDMLCLVVRSIGEATGLEVNGKGTGFIKCQHAVRTAPPVPRSARGYVPVPPGSFEPIPARAA
jgi:hypothetical protein